MMGRHPHGRLIDSQLDDALISRPSERGISDDILDNDLSKLFFYLIDDANSVTGGCVVCEDSLELLNLSTIDSVEVSRHFRIARVLFKLDSDCVNVVEIEWRRSSRGSSHDRW